MKLDKLKNVFVTGATGLIGSHLISELLKAGYQPVALYREKSSLSKVKRVLSYYHKDVGKRFSEIEWIKGEINDIHSYKGAIMKSDYVFHCAGLVSSHWKDTDLLQKVNVEGTKTIAQLCLGADKTLCFTSSVSVFDRSKDGCSISEKSTFININHKQPKRYAYSKYFAEKEVWDSVEKGLQAVIINPSVVIGPGNWKEGFGKIIQGIDRKMPFYTKGTTGFVDVRDVAKIMVQLMGEKISGKRFIISSENCKYKEILSHISQYLHKPKPFIPVPKLILNIMAATNLSKSLTFETVNAAFGKSFYQNKQIVETLNYSFIDIDKSLEDTCRNYLNDKNRSNE